MVKIINFLNFIIHWFRNIIIVLLILGTSCGVFATEEVIIQDLRIMSSELVDDMIYQWIKDPPLNAQNSVVLADISAPIGVDSRFNDFIENRIYELLQKNPHLQLSLIHCSACHQLVSHSNPERTIIRRGIDLPEVLNGLLKATPGALALSLNFEARDREISLQAHIFELASPQKIVWAHRYSSNMGLRSTLREANNLISLEEARKIQNNIIAGREPIKFVSRLQIHNFQTQSELGAIPPLLFIEQSLESEVLPFRNKRIGLIVKALKGIDDEYLSVSVVHPVW